jgi:flagellar basal body-associated protein FliL
MKASKATLIIVLTIVGVVFVAAVGIIASSEYLNRKSKRELTQLVSELGPGTSFTVVKSRLGEPSQVYTNFEELEVFGTTKDASITTNCLLHKFFHRGIPHRWLLIYTDRNTNAVIYADWQDM